MEQPQNPFSVLRILLVRLRNNMVQYRLFTDFLITINERFNEWQVRWNIALLKNFQIAQKFGWVERINIYLVFNRVAFLKVQIFGSFGGNISHGHYSQCIRG